ncbi:MAG: aldehyde dehydrogenase family protein [Comamonadaceae bacterium]|nr:aldehyde dehydrogenase family protein [Comamonadaceae bacterium]
MTIYQEEIFGPVLVVLRVRDARRRRSTLINANPYANGTAIFTRSGDAARRFEQRDRGRHGRHQRADPGADGVLLVRRLEGARCSATCTCTARKACSSTPAPRWSPRAGR